MMPPEVKEYPAKDHRRRARAPHNGLPASVPGFGPSYSGSSAGFVGAYAADGTALRGYLIGASVAHATFPGSQFPAARSGDVEPRKRYMPPRSGAVPGSAAPVEPDVQNTASLGIGSAMGGRSAVIPSQTVKAA